MNKKSLMVMRVLINHFHGGNHPTISALPDEEAEELQKLEIDTSDISIATRQPWQVVGRIHYSWVLDPLKQMPESLVPYVVASLPEAYKDKVAKKLGYSDLPTLSESMKHLLLDRLYEFMPIRGHLPLAFIPKQPFSELLELSKNQFLDLIDCLGVYDVAGELKQIVDRGQLAKLMDSLRKVQQGFLKSIIHERDRWSPAKLGLDQWGGDVARLQRALHIRGLIRLSKALKEHHPEFLVHLYRRIDTGRAKQIKKYQAEEESDQVIHNLGAELKKAISYIQTV